MNEKRQIERTTAEGFLQLLNRCLGTDFEIAELADSPDVRCKDSKGTILNLEITLTEDRLGDIRSRLGRPSRRGPEALSEHLRKAEGRREDQYSCLQGVVLDNVVKRIKEKLLKSYGPNTALVIRDTSGVDWDWDLVIDDLKQKVKVDRNPFDRGIWIIDNTKTKLYRVV